MRPLEPADLHTLAELAAESPALCGYPRDLARWAGRPSGEEVHAWIDGAGVVRLVLLSRPRRRHVGVVELVAREDGAELLAATVDLADTWTPVDRLELELPAGHPAVRAAQALGFVVEVCRVARLADGRDELLLARLRPGFVWRPPGVWPELPERRTPRPTRYTWREPTDADVAAIRALSTEPLGVFGTLQMPSASTAFYAERAARTPPDLRVRLMFDGATLVGSGSVMPLAPPGVAGLGMMIATAAQGQGAGRALLERLLNEANEAGFRRVELGVYEDNVRAVALYRRAGFVEEGARRFDTIRGGGHATTREMALTLRRA